MRRSTANFVASAIALLVLIVMVSVAVAATRPGIHFWLYEILGCLLTVPLAFAMWSGAIWNRGNKPVKGPTNWKEWLLLSLAGAGTSAVFLAIDVYIAQGNPGIGAIFTVGAVAMSVVALPSALRAWVLELLQEKAEANQSDA